MPRGMKAVHATAGIGWDTAVESMHIVTLEDWLPVECWCHRGWVLASPEDIRDGRTGSCLRRGCAPGPGEAEAANATVVGARGSWWAPVPATVLAKRIMREDRDLTLDEQRAAELEEARTRARIAGVNRQGTERDHAHARPGGRRLTPTRRRVEARRYRTLEMIRAGAKPTEIAEALQANRMTVYEDLRQLRLAGHSIPAFQRGRRRG